MAQLRAEATAISRAAPEVVWALVVDVNRYLGWGPWKDGATSVPVTTPSTEPVRFDGCVMAAPPSPSRSSRSTTVVGSCTRSSGACQCATTGRKSRSRQFREGRASIGPPAGIGR